jgi:hypothetical protein
MKITQDVREYAAQKEIDEQAALDVGMKEKAEEFVASISSPTALPITPGISASTIIFLIMKKLRVTVWAMPYACKILIQDPIEAR